MKSILIILCNYSFWNENLLLVEDNEKIRRRVMIREFEDLFNMTLYGM